MTKILYFILLCWLFCFQSAVAQQEERLPCGVPNGLVDSTLAVNLPWFGNNAWLGAFHDTLLASRAVRSTPPPPPTSVAAR
ncbi:MAG: hypothetical protein EAZ67_10780 [Cytophagales bacterium]|nr:MAG: hypothetical protein EAZ67_10780 [Cytophagales bacterium]